MTNSERHRWSDPISVHNDTHSGCEETERTCLKCGYVRITIHYPHGDIPGRAWRTREGVRAAIEHTPPCRAVPHVEAA